MRVVATPGAMELIDKHDADIPAILRDHLKPSPNHLSREDHLANLDALRGGLRVITKHLIGGQFVWVITEADGSSTCILLPSEY